MTMQELVKTQETRQEETIKNRTKLKQKSSPRNKRVFIASMTTSFKITNKTIKEGNTIKSRNIFTKLILTYPLLNV